MKEEFDFYNRANLKSYNLDESMRYQLSMLDTLDPFTRKHCENVANITCRLCEYMHLKTDFVVYCTTCAYLHDIGKLFIPSRILQKNGPLTDEEYEIMKTHTTIGYKMCMNDLNLRPYSAGPKFHHEALDGSGYPSGLKGSAIPIEGQIIRVADEFDAIVSKRQYKSHIGITDTLKILIENAHSGRNNIHATKALKKVVIEDTMLEISSTIDYLGFLRDNIKRLKQINRYERKMKVASTKRGKSYYFEGMKLLFRDGENEENYIKNVRVLHEYDVNKNYAQSIMEFCNLNNSQEPIEQI